MMNILIVEDDLIFGNQCVEFLLEKGFKVVYSDNAEKAKLHIINSKIDVAIIDLMLPPSYQIEGLNLYRYIKERNKSIRVVFMTGKAFRTTEIVAEAMKLGASDFLDKENILFFDKLLVTLYEMSSEINSIEVNTITILFLSADPTDKIRLRLGEEFREIHEKLNLAQFSNRFKLELPQLSVRPEDISQALLDMSPEIVHFSGHGASVGLVFENKTGQTQLIPTEALAALFEQFQDQVQCVILNACYSEIQAKAIANHIKYVIGMKQAIGDKAAIAFSVGFYQALGAGRTIEQAYKLGCAQIGLQGIPEHLTPVLIKKEKT